MLDCPRSDKFMQVFVGFQGAECNPSSSTRHMKSRDLQTKVNLFATLSTGTMIYFT